MEEKLRVYTHTCMHLTRPYVDLMVKGVVGIYCDPCRRRELWPMGVWRAARRPVHSCKLRRGHHVGAASMQVRCLLHSREPC
jgi:hypothetical protein